MKKGNRMQVPVWLKNIVLHYTKNFTKYTVLFSIFLTIIIIIIYIKQCSISKDSLNNTLVTSIPYVAVIEDSIRVTNNKATVNIQINKIEVFADIFFAVNNYGSTPAKKLQTYCVFLDIENPKFKIEFNPNDVQYNIYPKTMRKFNKHNVPVINTVRKGWVDYKTNIVTGEVIISGLEIIESFLHIYINYEDMEGNKHNSLSISLCLFDYMNKKVDIKPVKNYSEY